MINFNKTKEAPPETSKSHVLAQSAFSDEPKRAPEEAIKNWKGAQEAPYEMHVEADRPFYLGEKRIFEGEGQMKKIRFPLTSILSKEMIDYEK